MGRPDGHVELQKPKEKPLPTDCLHSTAFALESETLNGQNEQHYDPSLALQLGESLESEQTLFLAGTPPPRRLRPDSDEEILAADGELEESIEVSHNFDTDSSESFEEKNKLGEAIDIEEKKLWDEAVMEMGPIIKIILQQLDQSS